MTEERTARLVDRVVEINEAHIAAMHAVEHAMRHIEWRRDKRVQQKVSSATIGAITHLTMLYALAILPDVTKAEVERVFGGYHPEYE